MNVDKAICLVDKEFVDGEKSVKLVRGEEYTISANRVGDVTVFTNYWFKVPQKYFSGRQKYVRD